jgi:hypothetical protein
MHGTQGTEIAQFVPATVRPTGDVVYMGCLVPAAGDGAEVAVSGQGVGSELAPFLCAVVGVGGHGG